MTEMAENLILSTEDLCDLGNALRRHGFKIATQQCVWAQQLLVRLALQGSLPNEVAPLAAQLGPIFCCTPEQQLQFPGLFKQWLAERFGLSIETLPVPSPDVIPSHRKRAGLAFVFGLSLVVAITLGALAWKYWAPVAEPDVTNQGRTNDLPTPADAIAGQPIIPLPPPRLSLRLEKTLMPPPRAHWRRTLLSVVPLVLFGLWWIWTEACQRPVLQRELRETPRNLKEIPIAGGVRHLLPGLGVGQLARELRRRRFVHSRELDASATIQATIRQGGVFKPVFGSRVEPDYLILIDQGSLGDHQARLAIEITRTLAVGDVSFEIFSYDGNPQFCQRVSVNAARSHSRMNKLQTFSLHELTLRFPEHRLLLFSDGSGFFDSFTGGPAHWLSYLGRWPDKVVLTPEIPARWGRREWAIERLGLTLLPLSRNGLALLGNLFRDLPQNPLAPPGAVAAITPLFLRAPARWLEREPPDAEIVTCLCTELQEHLGVSGFQWLAACAVYPEVHWGLTLRLGSSLLSDQRAFERLVPRLARLVWLRETYFPDWFRDALLDRISRETEAHIRRLFDQILDQVRSQPSASIPLHIAVDEGQETGMFRRLWRRWRRKVHLAGAARLADPESPLRDYVFLRFLSRPIAPRLAVRAPAALLHVLFPHGVRLLGVRQPVVFAVCLLATLGLFGLLDHGTPALSSLAFGPDGKLLATGSADGSVQVWELATGKLLHHFKGDGAGISGVTFSPTQPVLASASLDHIRLWDTGTGKLLRTLNGNHGTIRTVAFDPSGQVLASAGRAVELWATTGNVPLQSLQSRSSNGPNTGVTSLAYDSPGSALASGSRDGWLQLWSLKDRELAVHWQAHTQPVFGVVFSPSGEFLVSGSGDHTVKLWNLRIPVTTNINVPLRTLIGHTGSVLSVAFHPSNTLLASGSTDRTVKLWDIGRGRSLQTLAGHSNAVASVAFDPTGNWLASASADGAVRVWSVSASVRYHALLIGCDYRSEKGGFALSSPVPDIRAVANVLQQQFGFGVRTLENPSYQQAMASLDSIIASLEPEDRFLLMLSGHGREDPKNGFAFMFSSSDPGDSLTSTELAGHLRKLSAQEAIVVVDAASGHQLISTETRRPNQPARIISRTVLAASGRGSSPPMDGGITNSPFTLALLQSLRSSRDGLTGQQLFEAVEASLAPRQAQQLVDARAQQRPSYGPFYDAGHTGGDFHFPPQLNIPTNEPAQTAFDNSGAATAVKEVDSRAPVQSDAKTTYPRPQPGQLQDREFQAK